MSVAQSAVEVIRDELVVAFSDIDTTHTLNDVAYRTTVAAVNTVVSDPDKIQTFPVLDIIFGTERMTVHDTAAECWDSEFEVYFVGYFKVPSASASAYPMTETAEAFLHDVKRVITEYYIKSIASASNRWKFKKSPGPEITRWVERDEKGNLQGTFVIKCLIQSFYKDVNLRPEVPA